MAVVIMQVEVCFKLPKRKRVSETNSKYWKRKTKLKRKRLPYHLGNNLEMIIYKL